MKQKTRRALSEADYCRIIQHLAYAKRLARQFYHERVGLGIELQDYEGAALLGLCDAASRYDGSRGIGFQTFSYFRIRGAMLDLLRRAGWVPRNHFSTLIEHGADELSTDAEASSEISESNDADPGKALPYAFAGNVTDLAGLAVIIEQVGIRVHLGSDKDELALSYAEASGPEIAATLGSTKRFLGRLIKQLPQREQQIIELRYYQGLTFEEMREHFAGVSKCLLSRLHGNALEMLRAAIVEEGRYCETRTSEYAQRLAA